MSGNMDLSSMRLAFSAKARVRRSFLVQIMELLNAERVAAIQHDFEENGELTLAEFVSVMLRQLPEFTSPTSTTEVHELVGHLIELFKEIDINGDGSMEWDEFTGFVVEKAFVFDTTNSVEEFGTYEPARNLNDAAQRHRHNNFIENIYYIGPLDSLVVLEQHASVVKLYDAADCSLLGKLQGQHGIPMAAEYLHDVRGGNIDVVGSLVTSCADMTMTLWDLAPGPRQYTVRAKWPTAHAQVALSWVEQHQTLYSASVAGMVHAWDIDNREEKSCMYGHDDIVTDLEQLRGLDSIASASMDARVCIWDMHNGTQRQVLLGHERGVTSVGYSSENRLLLSAGLDHHAYVWNPFSATLLYKLKGHRTSLVSVAESSPNEVITGDIEGVFKVWDLRTYQCLQTFSVADSVTDGDSSAEGLASFVPCRGGGRSCLVAATKQLNFFEQVDNSVGTTTDDAPVVCALFNAVFFTIATAAERSVKIWDALTGKLLRAYCNIASNDITAMCLDDRQRKFIIGDHDGTIKVYNYSNGALMKELDPHTEEISALVYCNEVKAVLSTSWDRTVVLHDELDPDHGTKLREADPLHAHVEDVTCAAVSYALSLIATGSCDVSVRVWDFETGKLEAVLEHSSTIVSVAFLEPFPLLVVSESSGLLKFWGVRMSAFKYYSALDFASAESPVAGDTSVLCMAWDPVRRHLFTGGERGALRGLDLSQLLEILDVKDSTLPEATTMIRRSSFVPRIARIPPPNAQAKDVLVKWSEPRAHDDGITSLDLSMEQGVIVTASFDCCVCVFSATTGSKLGTLVQGVPSGLHCSPHWNVPIDVRSHEEKERHETVHILEALSAMPNRSNSEEKLTAAEERRPSAVRRQSSTKSRNRDLILAHMNNMMN